MDIEICDEFYYRVLNKDKDIFNEFNTSKENILRNNKDIELYSGEWIKVKVNNFITHHVKPLETIEIVALAYNTNKDKIITDNNLQTDKLFIGQLLKIFK